MSSDVTCLITVAVQQHAQDIYLFRRRCFLGHFKNVHDDDAVLSSYLSTWEPAWQVFYLDGQTGERD